MTLHPLSHGTKILVYGNANIIADFIILDKERLSAKNITFANLNDAQKHDDLETLCLQRKGYNTVYFLPSVKASIKTWDAFIALCKHNYNNTSTSIIIVGNSSLILPNEVFQPFGFTCLHHNNFNVYDTKYVKYIITKHIATPIEEDKDFCLPSPNYHLELKQPQTETSTEDTTENRAWRRLVEKQAAAQYESSCIVM